MSSRDRRPEDRSRDYKKKTPIQVASRFIRRWVDSRRERVNANRAIGIPLPEPDDVEMAYFHDEM